MPSAFSLASPRMDPTAAMASAVSEASPPAPTVLAPAGHAPLPTRYRTLTFSAGFLCGQASLCVGEANPTRTSCANILGNVQGQGAVSLTTGSCSALLRFAHAAASLLHNSILIAIAFLRYVVFEDPKVALREAGKRKKKVRSIVAHAAIIEGSL